MSGWLLYAGDALALGGTAALTLAVLGVLRFGDVRARIHAASTGAALGVVPVLLASLGTGRGGLIARALLVAIFLMVTTPIGSHAVMRLCALGKDADDPDAPAAGTEL